MDFLVLSPPVTPPSEPACGAFLLAAGLTARGYDVACLDLSLEFFHLVFENVDSTTRTSIEYLLSPPNRAYTPMHHRSVTGHLHRHLRRFESAFPGWRLTLMDIVPPVRQHDPTALAAWLDNSPSPFTPLWQSILDDTLSRLKPRNVLISIAYLSQLPAAIDLVRHLEHRGVPHLVGGSLPSSLAATGHGLSSLETLLSPIAIDDGMSLIPHHPAGERLLDRLSWPRLLSNRPYFSARPIVPLTLSSGCHWNRCHFCPDRTLPHYNVPTQALQTFFETIPPALTARQPVIHLVDSALPPGRLRSFLPLSKTAGTGFFGFARPTKHLLRNDLLAESAASGCLMLQLGAESGSKALLDRFEKGIDPGETQEVLQEAAGRDIRTYVYLLFGLPGETIDDLNRTQRLVVDNAARIDFLNLSLFNLPRYCELSDHARDNGIEIQDFPGTDDGIRLYWPFKAGGVDTRQQARDFLKRSFKAHPDIRAIHLNTPRWFRAAHLALMTP